MGFRCGGRGLVKFCLVTRCLVSLPIGSLPRACAACGLAAGLRSIQLCNLRRQPGVLVGERRDDVGIEQGVSLAFDRAHPLVGLTDEAASPF